VQPGVWDFAMSVPDMPKSGYRRGYDSARRRPIWVEPTGVQPYRDFPRRKSIGRSHEGSDKSAGQVLVYFGISLVFSSSQQWLWMWGGTCS